MHQNSMDIFHTFRHINNAGSKKPNRGINNSLYDIGIVAAMK